LNLSSFVISVGQISEGAPPFPAGPFFHGAFFESLSAVAPDIATYAHEHLPRPFTLSNLHRRHGRTVLRITTLSDALDAAVEESFVPESTFLLGDVEYKVLSIEQERNSSYEDIYRRHFIDSPDGEPRRLRVCFQSPTTFRHKQGNHPLPVPAKVWHSWQESWNAFAGTSVGDDFHEIVNEFIFPSELKINAKMVNLGRAKLSGFTGEVTFILTKPESDLHRIARMLWEFSFFCGTGQKTTMGMGQTLPAIPGEYIGG
jgi:CRISPR-associated endoribonuclease Cas6